MQRGKNEHYCLMHVENSSRMFAWVMGHARYWVMGSVFPWVTELWIINRDQLPALSGSHCRPVGSIRYSRLETERNETVNKRG